MEVDVRVYAENVVDNVLKNRPTPRQWTGGSVNIMWVLSTFLWATVWVCVPILYSRISLLISFQDLVHASMFGLTELKKRVKQTKGD
jgi:hypothetical protein